MLGALVHGIPQVCLPRGADQPWNAAAVERAGAGLVVPPDAFSGETVREGVERVLARSSFAAAADRVAREIGTMLPARSCCPSCSRPWPTSGWPDGQARSAPWLRGCWRACRSLPCL